MSRLTEETRDLLLSLRATRALLREEAAYLVTVLEGLLERPDLPAGTLVILQGELLAAREDGRRLAAESAWVRALQSRASREALAETTEPGCESTGG